ncbi:hypothetical protein HJ01_00301 [Flavobacterium frigoris PS1]|uniref:Uncharacterized protein n=1 Tax=Flavobacterium frigoris (strain PS1) TaxID=1086011 RepID=H7FMJ4_FLAFP|nr:hypothetical protein HJ01_00301 [Flavobacterium frigoris PS1]
MLFFDVFNLRAECSVASAVNFRFAPSLKGGENSERDFATTINEAKNLESNFR